MLARFSAVETRADVWKHKMTRKGTGKTRQTAFSMARQHFGMSACWTQEGTIIIKPFDNSGLMFHMQSRPYINNGCHINASTPSRYDDLTVTFSDSNVDAVLISETWLKPHLLSTSYTLPDFDLIRNDRLDRRGGVAV